MQRKSKILEYANLSDPYERKARFAPALLAVCTFLPGAIVVSLPLLRWGVALMTGVGVVAVVSLGMSHLASAMGNRLQRRLFPDWPFDSPTNLRLSPLDSTCSKDQKQQWYGTIERVTGLSIQGAPVDDHGELDRLINDAVTAVRSSLWKHPGGNRLHTHNADYGFARNFAGLAPVWLSLSAVSSVICCTSLLIASSNLGWAIASTVLFLGLLLLHRFVITDYVKAKAEHYADSFFSALNLLDKESPYDHAARQHDQAILTTE